MSRRRYIYDEATKSMVEVGQDWTDTPRRAQTVTEQIVYGGQVATDGTPIDSRRKRREYMKATGSADYSDYTEHLAKKREERAKFYAGTERFDSRSRKEDIGRAIYRLREQRRK